MASALKALLSSCITYFVWVVTGKIVIPILLLMLLLPEQMRYHNRFFYGLSSVSSWLAIRSTCTPVAVDGTVPRGEPLVVVANHGSRTDLLFIEELLEGDPRMWVCRKSAGDVPLLGWLLRRIALPAHWVTDDAKLSSDLATTRENNMHLIMFPEATVSRDGKVHEFEPGFALAAIYLNRPVLPIYFKNTCDLFDFPLVNAELDQVKIVIGKPMSAEPGETAEAFTKRVQAWYLAIEASDGQPAASTKTLPNPATNQSNPDADEVAPDKP